LYHPFLQLQAEAMADNCLLMIFLFWQLQAAQASSRVQKWGGKGPDEVKPLLQ
jgi:hypothetical protein